MVLEWSKNDEKIRKLAKVCNNWIQNRGDTRHLFGPSPIIPLPLQFAPEFKFRKLVTKRAKVNQSDSLLNI